MSHFDLDPRLEADSVPVAELALCALRLMRDANYPWLLLIPRRAGAREIIDLPPDDRRLLMEEIALASDALREVAPCDKLNVGALGNMVPQLHVHVIARRIGDTAWPGPVWGAMPPAPYAPHDIESLLARLRTALGVDAA